MMKRLCAATLLFSALLSVASSAEVMVKEHTKKDGTVVHAYKRTTPNNTKADNYSVPGNYNPNTGKITGQKSDTGGISGGKTSGPDTKKVAPTNSAQPPRSKSAAIQPQKKSRAELEAIVRECENTINRYINQSAFASTGLVSRQAYEDAHRRLDEAVGELKQLPTN